MQSDELSLRLVPVKKSLVDFIVDQLKPYKIQAKKAMLRIELDVANEIPAGICVDWVVYSEILFHIMQNAVKFSNQSGTIRITTSYHPVDVTSKRKRNQLLRPMSVEAMTKAVGLNG